MPFPKYVKVVEVGPRDGLQNEKTWVDTEVKIRLIERLSQSGLSHIEATSFVSPKWLPQMKDAAEILGAFSHTSLLSNLAVLTPNTKGFENALNAGAKEVAVFAAASESFSQKNINCSIQQSIERFIPILETAKTNNIRVRGYLSCVLGCPYEGEVNIDKVVSLSKQLIDLGCYEVSLGDTIGQGTPLKARRMIDAIASEISLEQVAIHFHDTRGQALANIFACLEQGVSTIDAAVSGLGGCPYAKGASGNVATEDLVYMLHGMGISTNIDLDTLVQTSLWISNQLNRLPNSKLGQVAYRQQHSSHEST